MSGLSFISVYGADTDSDDSGDEILKSRQVLPSPNLSCVKVIDEKEEHSEDPQKHSGRVRSFPHTRGNWASFIYVSYPRNKGILKFIQNLKDSIVLEDNLHACDDFHISLSHTFVLRYHMIATFTSSLRTALQNIDRFDLAFDSVNVYCNEEQTRTFIALKVDCFYHRELNSIVEKCNLVLEEFRLPTYFEDPSFHASVLWVNGNKKKELTNQIDKLDFTKLQKLISESVTLDAVHSKVGNKIFQYALD